MDALDLLLDFVVTPGTGRPLARVGKAGSVFMVGGRGDRQFAADRLDTQRLAVAVDERHHHLPWWSSSACAKYADAPSTSSGQACAGSRWPGAVPSPHAQVASADPSRWRFAPLAPLVGSPPRGTSGAASPPYSRSCQRSRSLPPTPSRNQHGVHQPSEPRVREPQVKTCSLSCSSS